MTLKDVSPYPLILPPSHLTTWGVVDYAFGKHKLKYEVKMEAGGWEVIKKYVSLGLGISIVTSICLSGEENLAVRPVALLLQADLWTRDSQRQVPLARRRTLRDTDARSHQGQASQSQRRRQRPTLRLLWADGRTREVATFSWSPTESSRKKILAVA